MGFSICPIAVVAAPVETVWELLADPALYDAWWDAHTVRVEPEGKAKPGQVVYAKTAGLGRTWDVTLRVEAVDLAQHQVRLHIALPLGIISLAARRPRPFGAGEAGPRSCLC
jgi:hypothetical protein